MKNKLFLLLLLLVVSTSQGWSQQLVTGVMTDATGETLIGATIMVKGTSVGTVTDFDGKYSIKVTDPGAVLIFSYVGLVSQEITVGQQQQINVVLKENTQDLEEVVVIAYGSQKKETLTGAVSSVDTKQLLTSPNTSVANALQGKMPGVSTIQESGQPGAEDPKIFIRGVGSLTEGNSSPLILVDGVEGSFSQMDPNEIESISILKDASATAVFGVRGANGVILVTTRRGEEGKARIAVNSSVGFLTPTRMLDLADSYTFALAHNNMSMNDGKSPASYAFNDYSLERFRLGDEPTMYPDKNWRRELMKDFSMQTQHNVNVSGGTKKVRYFVSVGYLYQDGLLEQFEGIDYDNGFSYDRFNYRTNLDLDITPTTLMKVGIGGVLGNKHEASDDIWELFNTSAPMSAAGIVNGNIIAPDPDKYGTLKIDNNIIRKMYGVGYNDQMSNQANFDITLHQDLNFFTKGLSVEVKGSYNTNYSLLKKREGGYATVLEPHYQSEVDGLMPAGSIIQSNEYGFTGTDPGYNKNIIYLVRQAYRSKGYEEKYGRGRNFYLEASARYNRSFGNHTLGALVLYNQSKKYYMGGDYNAVPRAYVGVVGRLTYDYKSKYMAELNAGYNGSENFAEGNRFGLFPSGSLGWILTEEDFLKDNKVINYLKIRGSVGLVGNDNIGSSRFLYLPDSYDVNIDKKIYGSGFKYPTHGYNFGVNTDQMIAGAGELKLGNPNVTWETALKENIGLDFYTLDNRLKLTADVFYEDRKDILINRNVVSIFSGLTSGLLPAVNMGHVQNKGYELELKWNDQVSDFRYHVGFNMSYAKNKIIEMDEVPPVEPYLARTGHSVGTVFGYKSLGFYQYDDFLLTPEGKLDLSSGKPQLKEGLPGTVVNVYPGDIKYQDLNGDNLIDYKDQTNIGKPKRSEYTFGLNLGCEYKGLTFSMNWAGVTGADLLLSGPYRWADNRTFFDYQVAESWTTQTAYTATLPRLSETSYENNYNRSSDIWLRDGSYIKLKNLSIGYNITNKRLLRAIGAQAFSVKATGYNLLTFDYVDLIDPEGNPNKQDTYPIMRTVSLGLNLTF